MPNRLADETSPYLLQHKDNPVDWFPWGDEAFEKAKAEGKPVFLSVGYSSCHWCHVMEHESFEDDEVAQLLNKHFVSVKVDREERPDVDEAYMAAVQISSGRGGWPMSVFLTSDRKPFFAGTYFPKADSGKQPGFASILSQIAVAWATDRKQLVDAANEFGKALSEILTKNAPGTFSKLDEGFIEHSLSAIASEFDPENGGFGKAPKFPPHSALELLMAYALRQESKDEMREASLGIALATLQRMCQGGIRDHVGGGFHRYSTDERWLVPHFEKMLYDNALMLSNLVHGAAIAAQFDAKLEALLSDAAQDLLEWLFREMTSPEGLFYSALDADSEGVEGKYYVWTSEEARAVLGARAEAFMKAYGFEEGGNFHDEASGEPTGANIPYLIDLAQDFSEDLEKLRQAREKRVRPALDTKAIVGWNGLMIAALVDAGLIAQAEKTAEALLAAEAAHGRLPHSISRGVAGGKAFLDDYAGLIEALLKLGSTVEMIAQIKARSPNEFKDMDLTEGSQTGSYWIGHAARLAKEMVDQFYDEERGGFFSVASDSETLFGRTKPVFDQPAPSGNALAIRSMVALGDAERAAKSIQCLIGWLERAPHATEALLLAALPLAQPAPAEEAKPQAKVSAEVEVKLSAKELQANSEGWGGAEIVIAVPEGFHINGPNPPARWLVPTAVEVHPLKTTIDYPDSKDDQYAGEVRIPFLVELPKGESAAEFEVKVTYQACTETECQEPQVKTLGAVVLR